MEVACRVEGNSEKQSASSERLSPSNEKARLACGPLKVTTASIE